MTAAIPTYKADKNQEAITALKSGHHLVLAPPGCGKTKILADRVIHALQNGVPMEQMLCLTFTNRAAREMRSRIDRCLDTPESDRLFVGNVHRFCSHFLYHYEIIPKTTRLLDEAGSIALIQSLLHVQETGNYENERRDFIESIIGLQHLAQQILFKAPRRVCLYPNLLTQLTQFFHQIGQPLNAETFAKFYDHLEDYSFDDFQWKQNFNLSELLLLARQYQLKKEEHHLIDFDDLLLKTYTYATAHRDELPQYHWIQIDEVQDLSPIQFAIVDLFTHPSPSSVTLYLGDEQQAIFSFIGAQTSTMQWLKDRCLPNVHRLNCNYRSPNYLLQLFNTYAEEQLGVDPIFLPHADNKARKPSNALFLTHCERSTEQPQLAAHLVKHLQKKYPEERIALLVPWNKHADEVSDVFDANGIRHFKISGTDLFTEPPMQLLCAHLHIVQDDTNYSEWARVLHFTGLFNQPSDARRFTLQCRNNGIVPSDFIMTPGTSYLLQMEEVHQGEYVLLDTEATGLNVFTDDLLQIAAVKVKAGEVIDQLTLNLPSDKEVPAQINGEDNPLFTFYQQAPKTNRREGLLQILQFIKGLPLVGHHITFDLHLLCNNLQREIPDCPVRPEDFTCYDTLKAAHILFPHQSSYKLERLTEAFQLPESPTHLATDDVHATRHLFNFCMQQFTYLRPGHLRFLEDHQELGEKIRKEYGPHYLQTLRRLYRPSNPYSPVLVNELLRLYNAFIKANWISPLPKMRYVFRFLRDDVIHPAATPHLIEQLDTHLVDLSTYREADLCESSAIKEKIFISTVHKAKGLEFHNVLLYSANTGYYPFFYCQSEEEIAESARLFYVGMTRAQKRLYLLYSDTDFVTTRSGQVFPRQTDITPFIDSIYDFFKEKFYSKWDLRKEKTE